jgi:hypothetical protein
MTSMYFIIFMTCIFKSYMYTTVASSTTPFDLGRNMFDFAQVNLRAWKIIHVRHKNQLFTQL